jgi:hypothetical protein
MLAVPRGTRAPPSSGGNDSGWLSEASRLPWQAVSLSRPRGRPPSRRDRRPPAGRPVHVRVRPGLGRIPQIPWPLRGVQEGGGEAGGLAALSSSPIERLPAHRIGLFHVILIGQSGREQGQVECFAAHEPEP